MVAALILLLAGMFMGLEPWATAIMVAVPVGDYVNSSWPRVDGRIWPHQEHGSFVPQSDQRIH
jgi:hypothetical protein